MSEPTAIFLCDLSGVMAEPQAEAGYDCLCIYGLALCWLLLITIWSLVRRWKRERNKHK